MIGLGSDKNRSIFVDFDIQSWPCWQAKGDHPVASKLCSQSQDIVAHAHKALLKLTERKVYVTLFLKLTCSFETLPPRHWAKRPNLLGSVFPWSHLQQSKRNIFCDLLLLLTHVCLLNASYMLPVSCGGKKGFLPWYQINFHIYI